MSQSVLTEECAE